MNTTIFSICHCGIEEIVEFFSLKTVQGINKHHTYRQLSQHKFEP